MDEDNIDKSIEAVIEHIDLDGLIFIKFSEDLKVPANLSLVERVGLNIQINPGDN